MYPFPAFLPPLLLGRTTFLGLFTTPHSCLRTKLRVVLCSSVFEFPVIGGYVMSGYGYVECTMYEKRYMIRGT